MGIQRVAFLLVAAVWVEGAGGQIVETTWSGAAGNFLWTDAGNWSSGVPSRTNTVTALFDAASASAGTVTLGTGSNNRLKNTNFRFLSGAKSYTFTGADFIDNQSNTRTFATDAGASGAQVFASPVRIANHTITMAGSGSVTFARFYNENAWGDTSFNTGGWAVNHADAVLTINTFLQNFRGYTFTKSGPGKVVLAGVIDFAYGMNGAAFVSSKIVVNGGTLDLSAATINLEPHLDAGEALTTGAVYLLVNYANGTLAGNASFATTTGAPDGWEVVNDADNRRIVLREIPPGPTGTTLVVR